MRDTLYRCCYKVFVLTLIAFMLMGMAIVFVQILGVLLGHGNMVYGINAALKTYAIWVASVCGFAGFFAGYLKPKKK